MDFPFPFAKPYQVQNEFMTNLYQSIENKQIGLFESPTGTGKSLSLICGAMKWLKTNQQKPIEDQIKEKLADANLIGLMDPKDPKWLNEQKLSRARRKIEQEILDRESIIEKKKNILRNLRSQGLKKTKKIKQENESTEGLDWSNDYLLNDYQSDVDESFEENLDDVANEPKIIYASRTHTQISQFVAELKRTVYAEEKLVCLGSRKNLCVNPLVNKLPSLAQINDQCIDLQGGSSKCTYRQSEDENEIGFKANFALQLQAVVRDIEDTFLLGKDMHVCPYYGVRKAVVDADVICIPYNLLLLESSRIACNINLKNSIVIIDEAHNLIDSINSIYSVTIEEKSIRLCLEQLNLYYEKYKARLAARNSLYVKRLILIMGQLLNCKISNEMYSVPSFVSLLDIEHVNLFKTIRFLEVSRIANKLQGFSEKARLNIGSINLLKHESPLRHIETFIRSLAYPDFDGRILCSTDGTRSFKYLLLNPSNVFRKIVDSARSVILAGGTMSPMDDFVSQLFPDHAKENLHFFSCDHVIHPDNLKSLILNNGPSGKEFNFRYQTRNNPAMIRDAGSAVLRICRVVHGGVIVFFPSYNYLELVLENWKNHGVLKLMEIDKHVFAEKRSADDNILSDFTNAIRDSKTKKSGALLFSVVGGKLSEGINFSDDLGRAVIMLGLPYPNKNSLELQERMKYLDKQQKGISGSEYYENLCMKAVNQCIGRVIRHQNDFASIILLDKRYSSPRVRQKLPAWIAKCGITEYDSFDMAERALKPPSKCA